MASNMSRAGAVALDPGYERLNRVVVTLATVTAVPFAAILLIIGLVSGRADVVGQAIVPVITGGLGVLMLWRRRPRALVHLLIVGLALAIYVGVAATEAELSAIVGLVAIGMTGSLFVRGRPVLYVAGVGAAILGATFWWHVGSNTAPEDHVLASLGPALLFVFTSWLLLWLRRELESGQIRFQNLFDRAPVAIWEFDLTDVAQWLENLRGAGVTDLRGYLATNPYLIVAATRRIEVVNANQIAAELLDLDQLFEAVAPDHRSGVRSLHNTAVKILCAIWDGESSVELETEILTREGTKRTAILRLAAPVVEGRAQLDHVIITATDITELREGEQALQRLVRSKDDFVASVSHELRTPLTAVVGFAEELRDHLEAFQAEDVAAFVNMIAHNGAEVAHIVDDLLVMARADGARLKMHLESVDVMSEVEAVVPAYSPRALIDFDEDWTPRAIADPARLRQILRNLLTNANRHGTGQVVIKIATKDSEAHIEVRDQGPAIPEVERDRIFEPYYRLEQVSGLTGSVGLGLTVSRQLARMMGGDLEYGHDGEDAVFRIILPLETLPPAAADTEPGDRALTTLDTA